MQITLHGLNTEKKIKAIVFLKNVLAPIADNESKLGLKAAKELCDQLERNEINVTVHVHPGYEKLVIQAAEEHGFLTHAPQPREVLLVDRMEAKEPVFDDIPF